MPSKLRIYKALNGAENAFADRPLLLDENDLFFGQNNEANKRKSVKPKVIGTAKVLSYGDLVEAEAERDKRSAMEIEKAGRSKSKRTPAQILVKRSRNEELEDLANQVPALGMESYCSVLRFD